MDVVKLKDGSIEIIGSHRDLVDVIRDKCGDEVAKMVDNLEPSDVFSAYESLSNAQGVIYQKDDDGLLTENQVDEVEFLIDKAVDMLLSFV